MLSGDIGLFLGAGASHELGMPLAWDLTREFKGFWTEAHFRRRCAESQASDVPISDQVRDEVLALLARSELHYENILGYLQTAHRRLDTPQDLGREYHRLYVCMLEVVYGILYHRQVLNFPYIDRGFPPFEGLQELVEKQSGPLWVFSLNHDVTIELLSMHLGLPLRDGFWRDKGFSIPYAPTDGGSAGSLNVDVVSETDIQNSNLDFFHSGRGINLFKLHGALNVFAFRDGKDLCRLVPTDDRRRGILDSLIIANELLEYRIGGEKHHVLGEIVYTDADGEMQFLRHTLLGGSQKFSSRYSQTLPHKMLAHFKSLLNHVRNLKVVGYSFGDPHVDAILREWLESVSSRQMTIVDPFRQGVPEYFRHLAPQIDLARLSAGDFFLAHRTRSLSMGQKFERWVRQRFRPLAERRAAHKW